MVVHPAAGHQDDTLVNALLARYPQLRDQKDDVRPGIVHRLDKDTSGLLIIAKNIQTQAALIEMLKQHSIVKRYLALVEGVLTLDHGSVDAPIGRDSRNRQQMTITATGRESRTNFRVLQRFARHTLLLLRALDGENTSRFVSISRLLGIPSWEIASTARRIRTINRCCTVNFSMRTN